VKSDLEENFHCEEMDRKNKDGIRVIKAVVLFFAGTIFSYILGAIIFVAILLYSLKSFFTL